MNDPTRLLLGDTAAPLDERERRLLRAAVDEQPSAEAFGQLSQALGLTASVVPPPPVHVSMPAPALRAPPRPPSTALLPKWVLGLGAGSVLTGALLSTVLLQSTPSASPPEARSRSVAQPAEALSATSAGSAAATRDTRPAMATPAAPASPPALADELRRLDLVRAALRARAPAEALTQLRTYQQHHAAGTLGEEAEALHIETALALGRRAEATQRGQAFLRAHPESVHRARIRALLAQASHGD